MVEAFMFAHTQFQMRIYACNHVYCLKLVDMYNEEKRKRIDVSHSFGGLNEGEVEEER